MSIRLGLPLIGLLLAGCAGPGQLPISASSICSPDPKAQTVFHDPGFAVRGATRKDQMWISSTQEAGIRACGWQRPPHITPAVVSRRPKVAVSVEKPTPAVLERPAEIAPPIPPPKPKKKHWWQRKK